MKVFELWMKRYLIYISPVVVATMIWGTNQSDAEIRRMGSVAIKALWEIMSWSLMIWFLCLFIFVIMLALRKDTQESTIKYLAGIKERDEREQAIMGLAARRSFTATSGFLILLLFLSCFTLTVAKIPPDQVIDKKSSSLSIGFNLMATNDNATKSADGMTVFEHHDLPLSKSAIVLLVLMWQILTFRISARSELVIK